MDSQCLCCASMDIEEIAEFRALARVTSDTRPFPAGGELYLCQQCGLVQKRVTPAWLEEIRDIYAHYYAYHQAGGDEQVVLDSQTGTIRRRSDVIIGRLKKHFSLPAGGRWLDIACGTGVTLKSVSEQLDSWKIWAQEMDDRFLPRFRDLRGFVELFTVAPDKLRGEYDFLSLVHALEHFICPLVLLQEIKPRLAPGGHLLVQVYDLEKNPFDLVIADHLTHFTVPTLSNLAKRAGYGVAHITTGWVSKEISAIFSAESGLQQSQEAVNIDAVRQRVRNHVLWLAQMPQGAGAGLHGYPVKGLFGTSIAATWLAGALREEFDFFVDEDPSRFGKSYLGKPVLSPADIPSGAGVYLGLAPQVATQIALRLKSDRFEFILPPAYSDHA